MTNNILVPIITDNALLFDPLIGGDGLLSVLGTANNSVRETLRDFALSPEFSAKMELTFGQGVNVSELRDAWAVGEVRFPTIEIRSAAELKGAYGAFSAATNTIYLSSEFLGQNASNPDAITAVLLEEFGHSLDARLNEQDSAGDEGAIFSALVRGQTFSGQELKQLQAEDDTATITLEGQKIEVEQSEAIVEWVRPTVAGSGNNFNFQINEVEVDESNSIYHYVVAPSLGLNVLAKYDAQGNQLWVTEGIASVDIPLNANYMEVDSSGNVYIGGTIKNGADRQVWLGKYDTQAGELLWSRTFGSPSRYDYLANIGVDANGNIFLYSHTYYGLTAGQRDGFSCLDKYDTTGNLLWTKIVGVRNDEYVVEGRLIEFNGPWDMAVDRSGNIYFLGVDERYLRNESDIEIFSRDAWTAKYDSNGRQQWEVYVDGSYFESEIKMAQSDDRGFALGKYNEIAQYDSLGNLQWTTQLVGGLAGWTVDSIGNVYAVTSPPNSQVGMMAKYTPQGNLLWSGTVDRPTGGKYGIDLAVDNDQFVYTTGLTDTGTNIEAWVAKLNLSDTTTPPTIVLNDITVEEGDTDSVNAVFTVTLSKPSDQTLTVNYTTVDGTAIADTDYLATNGTLTFTAGETEKTITVEVLGDTEVEADEDFYIELSNPNNGEIKDSQAVGHIIDNDLPALSIEDAYVEVLEGKDQERKIKFTVTLSAPSPRDVTIEYFTQDGTATSIMEEQDSRDYEGVEKKTLTFAPGETTKNIEIKVFGESGIDLYALEYFAKESVYRKHWQQPEEDSDGQEVGYGYRIDTIFDDENDTGLYAFGLTSNEHFSVVLANPTNATINQEQTEAKGIIYDRGKDPVLVFRGTDGTPKDWLANAHPKGVGFDLLFSQNNGDIYPKENKDILTEWLKKISNIEVEEEKSIQFQPHITGHSLGGALTQWMAAYYTSLNDKDIGKLGQVVTFNSPGITASAEGQYGSNYFNPSKVDRVLHNITQADVVSMAGEKYIPGWYLQWSYDKPDFGFLPEQKPLAIFHRHGSPVYLEQLPPNAYNLGNEPIGQTIGNLAGLYENPNTSLEKPNPLSAKLFYSVASLNNPFFTYGKDPDYLATQLWIYGFGASLISTGLSVVGKTLMTIAGSMTYRVTAEAVRKSLGMTGMSIEEILTILADYAQNANNQTQEIQEKWQATTDAVKQWGDDAWNSILNVLKKAFHVYETNNTPVNLGLEADNLTLSEALEQALEQTQGYLTNFADSPDFEAKLKIAFGTEWDTTAADTLRQSWANGDFSNIPTIQVVPSAEIGEANGAYDLVNGNIYLSSEYLTQHTEDTTAIATLISEEVGHHIDSQINLYDAAGDEGAIFASLVRNIQLSDEELQALKAENDISVVERSTAVWEALAQWPVQAWNASVTWPVAAWNAISQWTDDTWQATTEWTPEKWNETTQWTEEMWNATINTAPVVEISDQTFKAYTPLNLDISAYAKDTNAGDKLTLTATLANGDPLPKWLSFNPNTGILRSLPTVNEVGTLNIKVIAKDLAGASASDTFALSIALPANPTTKTIKGTDKSDRLEGTANNDDIYGFNKNDHLFGNGGDDNLYGNNGNDQLNGGPGNDLLLGDSGNDQLHGDDGKDVLIGTEGNDVLRGVAGDDLLDGGIGNDELFGDAGNDRFVLRVGDGKDTISNFEDGKDSFWLAGGLTFGQLGITQSNSNTLIAIVSNSEVLASLTGISASLITEADFISL